MPELKGTDISGLFGDSKKTKPALGKKEMNELKLDLGEMEELEELGEEGEEEIPEDEEEKEEIPESDDSDKGTGEKGTCINCKQEFNELIFCSKCGNAFCDKCAKTKQKTDKGTKYVCPSCGHPTKK